MDEPLEPKPCKRCKTNPPTLDLRADRVCGPCFAQYIRRGVIKRMGNLNKELRTTTADTSPNQRYLLGLSFGSSSAALFQMLYENQQHLRARNPGNVFDLVAVHVDFDYAAAPTETPGLSDLLEKYRSRFPLVPVETVPLSSVLELSCVDWGTLPQLRRDVEPPMRLWHLLDGLPSPSARVDLVRLFLRHLLISTAKAKGAGALLLGSSTTALAEVTISEVAKGRGFGAPWQIADGAVPVPDWSASPSLPDLGGEETTTTTTEMEVDVAAANKPSDSTPARQKPTQSTFPVYHPLRDTFRHETVTYNSLSEVDMMALAPERARGAGNGGGKAVSHRDLSIEDVVAEHFSGMEVQYPNIVANVVRTTEKLRKVTGPDPCGVCGMRLDEGSDARWEGEIGKDQGMAVAEGWSSDRLCYGCRRSLLG